MLNYSNYDYLNGLLRFSHFCIFLDIIAFILFISMWIISYKKTKWKLDFWHFVMTLLFLIPVIIMYPFAAAMPNIISVGEVNYYRIEPFVNYSFVITLIGFLFMYVGRLIYDIFKLNTPLIFIKLISQPFEKIIRLSIRSKLIIYTISFLTIVLLLVNLIFQIKIGYLFNPRGYFLQNDILRPFYNFILSLNGFTLPLLFIRYLLRKERIVLFFIFIVIILSFFAGTRGAFLFPLVESIVFWYFLNQKKISFLKIINFGVLIIFLVLLIENLRSGEVSFNLFIFLYKIFYGNNFSDIRDFAWVLAYWNGEYVYGKTQIAGLISFIPSFLSDYRYKWSLSRYTNEFVGFDSTTHAGLRPGIFGESYLNFGIYGVILMGFLGGYFLRHVDVVVRQSIDYKRDICLAYSKTFSFKLISSLFISVGMFKFYTQIFVLILILVYYNFLKGIKSS